MSHTPSRFFLVLSLLAWPMLTSARLPQAATTTPAPAAAPAATPAVKPAKPAVQKVIIIKEVQPKSATPAATTPAATAAAATAAATSPAKAATPAAAPAAAATTAKAATGTTSAAAGASAAGGAASGGSGKATGSGNSASAILSTLFGTGGAAGGGGGGGGGGSSSGAAGGASSGSATKGGSGAAAGSASSATSAATGASSAATGGKAASAVPPISMITGLFGNKAAKPATAGKPGAPGGENAAADPAGAANGAGAANVAGAGSPHGPANAVTSGGGGGRPPIPEMASDSALTGGAAENSNQSHGSLPPGALGVAQTSSSILTVYGCTRRGTQVLCDADLKNQNATDTQVQSSATWKDAYLVDDRGDRHQRTNSFFVNVDGDQRPAMDIPYGHSARYIFVFNGVSSKVQQVTLTSPADGLNVEDIPVADANGPTGSGASAGQAPAAAPEASPTPAKPSNVKPGNGSGQHAGAAGQARSGAASNTGGVPNL